MCLKLSKEGAKKKDKAFSGEEQKMCSKKFCRCRARMIDEYYEWIKAAHVVSMVAWMAGMLYLPRLYIYHAEAAEGSDKDKTFQVMERRLLRGIMNPALILAFLTGLSLAYIYGFAALGPWFHVKALLVLVLVGMHGFLAKWRVDLRFARNKKTPFFFKVFNETITVIFVLIVVMVVVKPFEG